MIEVSAAYGAATRAVFAPTVDRVRARALLPARARRGHRPPGLGTDPVRMARPLDTPPVARRLDLVGGRVAAVIGVLLAIITVMLWLAPLERPSWRELIPGAVLATTLWIVSSGGFAFFTATFDNYNKTWGSLSAVIVTLVWLWLTSLALLLGAELNARRSAICGPTHRLQPTRLVDVVDLDRPRVDYR